MFHPSLPLIWNNHSNVNSTTEKMEMKITTRAFLGYNLLIFFATGSKINPSSRVSNTRSTFFSEGAQKSETNREMIPTNITCSMG
jgi:hypothetical protein